MVAKHEELIGKKRRSSYSLLVGPLLFFLVFFCLPKDIFPYEARGAMGTVIWMAFWWISRPVHSGITALLPLVINSLFHFVPMGALLPNYMHPIIILLLGANILTLSWSRWGLDKRIALRALCLIGPGVKQQVIVWFTVSVVLTIFLPNIVVASVLSPVAASMLLYTGISMEDKKNEVAIAIWLSIAWGTGLGGFGSPLGGAMNLIAINYIEEMVIGQEYLYLNWIIAMLPMLVLVSLPILIYLIAVPFESKNLLRSREFFKEEYGRLPSINKGERRSLFLSLFASLFAFGRPLYESLFPGFTPPFVFLFFGFLSFFLSGEGEEKLATWENTGSRLMWGLFFLVAGGIALGDFISVSGAGEIIANLLSALDLDGGFFTILIFVLLGIFLSNISSNTAAVAILIPIVGSVILALEINPVPYIYVSSVACNCAYMLPTSVRAIPVAYGLDPKILWRKGFIAVLLSLIIVTIFGYLFTFYWRGFSLAF